MHINNVHTCVRVYMQGKGYCITPAALKITQEGYMYILLEITNQTFYKKKQGLSTSSGSVTGDHI